MSPQPSPALRVRDQGRLPAAAGRGRGTASKAIANPARHRRDAFHASLVGLSRWTMRAVTALLLILGSVSASALDDVHLSAEEQQRLGIEVAPAQQVERADRHAAFGRVLDLSALADLQAEISALDAALSASQAEATRSEALYRAGENASQRQWQRAQASARADQARLQAARLRLSLQWGPALAGMDPHERAELMQRVAQGRASLIVAVAPGLRAVQNQPVQVWHRDPQVPGTRLRVLGPAASASAGVPGDALLLLHEGPALQAGAGIALDFSGGAIRGLQVPASALLADGRGMSVYVRRSAEHFERRVVRVLLDAGAQVLIDAAASQLEAGAEVVTTNAATLRWAASAKLRAGAGADDDDDDD